MAVLLAAPVAAAGQTSSPLTVEEAVTLALTANPSMRASAAAEDAAAARVRQTRAGFLPRVDVVESWQRSDHPVFVFSSLLAQRRFTAADFALDVLNHPEATSNHRAAIMLEQPLFDGFRTRSAARSARLDAEIAGLDTARAGADLRLSVVAAFGRALAARAGAVSARAMVATAEEDVRRAIDRRDAGLETEASVLTLRVHLADAEARRVKAISDETIARAALNALLGAPLDDDRPLAPFAPSEARTEEPAALEVEAMRSRPEIRQAEARHQRARASAAMAGAGLWPHVSVHGGAEANGAGFAERKTAWSAGLQVRWNLFAGGGDRARVAEAEAEVRRALAERERVETGIRLEVRSALAEHEAAIAREIAGRQMVEQARESQRIIRDRYDAGLAPASDVLRAAERLAQSEAARIGASIEIQVTAAALDRATGRSGR